MLFHILVGKLLSLELIHHIDAISHIPLQNVELIHHIDAISHIGWKVTKFRVNTSYKCFYSRYAVTCT